MALKKKRKQGKVLCRMNDKFQLNRDIARVVELKASQIHTQWNRISIGRECENSTSGVTKKQEQRRKVQLEGNLKEMPWICSVNGKRISSSSVQQQCRELSLLVSSF